MKRKFWWLLIVASVVYLLIVMASYVTMMNLPSHGSVGDRQAFCYRTDALIVYVKCGSQVPFRDAKSLFLNLWIYFFYGKNFIVWGFSAGTIEGLKWLAIILAYISPVFVLIFGGIRFISKALPKARESDS